MPADLAALTALMPFAADLGVELEEASADRIVATLPWAARLCTVGGILHGGAIMTLADSAGALVIYLGLPQGASTATMTSTTQFFRPVSAGTVRAVAVPLPVAAARPRCRLRCATLPTSLWRRQLRSRRYAARKRAAR